MTQQRLYPSCLAKRTSITALFHMCFFSVLLTLLCSTANAAQEQVPFGAFGKQEEVHWRLRFFESAIVQGSTVLLHEIAAPAGDMPAELWEQIKNRPLWPSPPEGKGPVNMTRPKLQEAVMRTIRDLAPYCLFPGSMALQRGGAVLPKEAIHQMVVNELTPILQTLPGEVSLSDLRLPQYIFLKHPGQTVALDMPRKISAGRLSIRLLVKELDGSIVQKLTGSVFVDSWLQVPSAAVPLNKDDVLEATHVTFIRANLAHLRGEPWDGRGGPWRVLRPIGLQQVIYQADLGVIPTVRKGMVVTLVYAGKHITLTAKAEALSDGVAGETIAVKNMQSQKTVYGIIKDASTVLVMGAHS